MGDVHSGIKKRELESSRASYNSGSEMTYTDCKKS
jgi:hypothetical protein